MSHASIQISAPDLVAEPIALETPADAAGVDALVLAAFGPGRFAKTAERLREGRVPPWASSPIGRAGSSGLSGCGPW